MAAGKAWRKSASGGPSTDRAPLTNHPTVNGLHRRTASRRTSSMKPERRRPREFPRQPHVCRSRRARIPVLMPFQGSGHLHRRPTLRLATRNAAHVHKLRETGRAAAHRRGIPARRARSGIPGVPRLRIGRIRHTRTEHPRRDRRGARRYPCRGVQHRGVG